MKTQHHRLTVTASLTALAAAAMFLLLASPLRACTLDEIVAMSDAGLPPEVMIEVIEATGLDDPIDIDTITDLAEFGVDSAVLEYLTGYLEDEADDEEEAMDDNEVDETSRHPNWAGGEGFHHGGTGYNPLRDAEPDGNRREGWSRRRYSYNPYHNVVVYEPPVYVLYNRPYYRAYRAPRFYDRHRYTDDWIWFADDGWAPRHTYSYPRYGIPWSRAHGADWWRDRRWRHYDGWGGNLSGRWYYDGRRHDWDGSFNVWWHDDDFSIRLGF